MKSCLEQVDVMLKDVEAEIDENSRGNAACLRLIQVPGIGRLTASALQATIGEGQEFKLGRQLAVWLGLVPKQHSSGGKVR